MPMATIAVVVDAPYAAARITASKMAGKAKATSATRPIVSSSQPPRTAATKPSGIPIRPETPTATTPT